ncbi:hypothetical protein ACFYO9_07890 [Streptomyces sp. NPDC005863]|uniref:hypothetical protein n=1 Tax=unclassified Streptomyces TaxID=2593676 RepID=UPI0033EE0F1B
MFEARDSKQCMGHADFSERGVELYVDGQNSPTEVVDLDERLVGGAGRVRELLRQEKGARLVVDVDQEGGIL